MNAHQRRVRRRLAARVNGMCLSAEELLRLWTTGSLKLTRMRGTDVMLRLALDRPDVPIVQRAPPDDRYRAAGGRRPAS